MIPVAIHGGPAHLLHVAPDGRRPFRMELEIPANRERSLSGRELRRANATRLRCTTTYSIVALGEDAQRVKAGLRATKTERVAIPAWSFAKRWEDRGAIIVSSGLRIVWKEGWSTISIYQDEEPEWPEPGDLVAPLLVGRLTGRDLQWVHAGALTMTVEHEEASPWTDGLQFVSVDTVDGPLPSAAYDEPPSMMPGTVEFSRMNQSVRLTVDRRQIGFGREPLEETYEEPAEEFAQSAIATDADIAAVISHVQCHAAGRPFWLKSSVGDLELSEDVAADQTVLPVHSSEGIQVGDWLAIGAGYARVTAKGDETVTVEPEQGPLSARWDLISRLVLVRFVRPQLTIEWHDADVIRFTFPAVELVEEYDPAEGEVLGQTIGETCPWLWLYELSVTVGGVELMERLTSHEQDAIVGGHTYTAARINHDAIAHGIALDRDEVILEVDVLASDLIRRVATLEAQGPVRVRILRAQASGPCGCKNQPPIDGDPGGPEPEPLPIYDPEGESDPPEPSGDLDDEPGYGEPLVASSSYVWGWDAGALGSDPNELIDEEVIRCHMATLMAEIEMTWPGAAVDTIKWVWDPYVGTRLSMGERYMRMRPPYQDPALPCDSFDSSLNVSISYAGIMQLAAVVYPLE